MIDPVTFGIASLIRIQRLTLSTAPRSRKWKPLQRRRCLLLFFVIPFLGIRVLSNNITNHGTYNAKTGEACQDYVYDVVKAYIGTLKR